MTRVKKSKRLERHFKGAANHYRIEILLFLGEHDGGILDENVHGLAGNPKTISQHTRKLVRAGLLNKTYQGRYVSHTLSPYGKKFVQFIKSFPAD